MKAKKKASRRSRAIPHVRLVVDGKSAKPLESFPLSNVEQINVTTAPVVLGRPWTRQTMRLSPIEAAEAGWLVAYVCDNNVEEKDVVKVEPIVAWAEIISPLTDTDVRAPYVLHGEAHRQIIYEETILGIFKVEEDGVEMRAFFESEMCTGSRARRAITQMWRLYE